MKRDCPNYRAFPLRPAFLITLFLFVLGLTVALEYLLRVLPNEHDRNKIPQDSPYIVAQRRRRSARRVPVDSFLDPQHGRHSYTQAKPAGRAFVQGQGRMDDSKTTTSAIRTPDGADIERRYITKAPTISSRALDMNVKIPESSMYET